MEDPKFVLELVGLFLTLMILLYMIFGDNALFRIVTYTFIGVTSGYVIVLVFFQVLLPRLANLLRTGNLSFMVLSLIPFVLGILLLFKLSSRLSALGTLSLAVLAGVGAAVAVGGAIFGTLFGQILGTIHRFNLFNLPAGEEPVLRLLEAVFVLVGAVATLAYFQFSTRARPAPSADPTAAGETVTTVRRNASMELLARIGQIFIGITLGAMFAGVFTAAISALIERIGFVVDVVTKLMAQFL